MKLSEMESWNNLQEHAESISDINITDLNTDANRFEKFSFSINDLFVDFSKQKINSETLKLLHELALEKNLKQSIKNLAIGKEVNTTEKRPALHTACRLSKQESLIVNGEDINISVQNALERMSCIVEKLTHGQWRGYSGKPITDVVNLGVGGSDLGPMLVCHALDEWKAQPKNPIAVHFASTMDGSQVSEIFQSLNPETTLFVIVSKSFSTIDTLSNAASAKAWLMSNCNNEKIINKQHFIGVSVNENKMSEWGVDSEHQLKLWEWVGGRFSLWSTVGLTIALKIGMGKFCELLQGANATDKHFFETPLDRNIPVLLGLIGIWNTNFQNIGAQAILPYDARLKYLPNYLMQLEMESNGKSVTQSGKAIDYETCPVIWGEVGPNAQHAFYQLLHQGTRKVCCDFIAPIKRFANENSDYAESLQEQHALTLANCFAQSRALMVGGTSMDSEHQDSNLSSHKNYPGNQPSTTILLKQLSPYSLGQLIALYEHKVFVMAAIWGINPFDQWGVELGKIMANDTLSEISKKDETKQFDFSTNGLINKIKKS